MKKLFIYKGEKVYLEKAKYSNNRIALEMKDLMGLSYARITVNLPEQELQENEIIVKTYSENIGMIEWLQENNIVGRRKGVAVSGFVFALIVELFPEEQWKGENVSEEEFNKFIADYVW